eukprot:12283757-Alexandrium_andersonii.AAC.1
MIAAAVECSARTALTTQVQLNSQQQLTAEEAEERRRRKARAQRYDMAAGGPLVTEAVPSDWQFEGAR